MHDRWQDKLYLFLLHRIPLISSLILMFLFFMPINSLQFNYFRPIVGIICVHYWTAKRGYMFSYISAFIIGFLMDIYSSSPLGLNSFLMMLLVFVTNWFARHFQSVSFGLQWMIFGTVSLGYILLKWLILMAYFRDILPIGEVFFNYLSTVMFYPLIVIFNVWIQHFLPQERINE